MNAKIKSLMKHPEKIRREVGFEDLVPMHGEWIRAIVLGTEDYTLQARRGAYKSSCLAVAIALIMIRFLDTTDREYIDQILDYTEFAEHDDAPDSAATVCRYFFEHWWG